MWLTLRTKSIIYAAGRRVLKCVLPLYLLVLSNGCVGGGFKPCLLILSYSSFLLFKTRIYRPSGTAKKLLIGEVKSDFSVKNVVKVI